MSAIKSCRLGKLVTTVMILLTMLIYQNSIAGRVLLVVTDLVDETDYFKQNIYYNDILATQDYVYKMVLYLMDGERFIGGMSFCALSRRSLSDTVINCW